MSNNVSNVSKIGLEREMFVCDCGDLDHQFVLTWFSDYPADEPELFVNVHLAPSDSFWKKAKIAFRYLFSRSRSRFGDFDEIILDKSEVARLRDVLSKWLDEIDAKEDYHDRINRVVGECVSNGALDAEYSKEFLDLKFDDRPQVKESPSVEELFKTIVGDNRGEFDCLEDKQTLSSPLAGTPWEKYEFSSQEEKETFISNFQKLNEMDHKIEEAAKTKKENSSNEEVPVQPSKD